MDWKQRINEFKRYLKLERGLSSNTVVSYTGDLQKLADFAEDRGLSTSTINVEHLRELLKSMQEIGQEASSQARFISSLRSFFGYLLSE